MSIKGEIRSSSNHFTSPSNELPPTLEDSRDKHLILNNLSTKQQELRKKTNSFYTQLEKSIIDSSLSPSRTNKKSPSLEDLEKQMSESLNEMRDDINQYSLKASEEELSLFGNKHKNLIKQARLAQALDLENILNLEVPIPQGFTSDQISNFLQKVAPQVFTKWNELKSLYEDCNDKSSFLKTGIVKDNLELISKEIKNAFEKAAKDDDIFSLLAPSKELLSWIKDIDKKESYLMVRSTGAEDSRQAANAGGNLSLNYVTPKKEDLLRAIGEVISSYFGISSLQNRINANINPFKEEILLAVTIQELIGEPINGAKNHLDIPISLVAFSNEPLYVDDEKFRVMRISASFGHGEGVVSNQQINSDTILILNSLSEPDKLYILYDNQKKPVRLAPVYDENEKQVILKKTQNPPGLINRKALSLKMIARLFHWAVLAEKYFEDEATDMEIVIKNNKIYPVQARPVNRKTLLPTYLDLKKVEEKKEKIIEKSLQTEMLVVGKASSFEIKNSDEILIATTLEEAEKLYIKDQHKLVVVYQPEPANSHPVVNFSSLSVPCLYASEKEEMEDLLSKISKDNSLVVCMQAASLHLWNNEYELKDYLSHGFTVHPAKIAISLSSNNEDFKEMDVAIETPDEVKDIITRIRAATSQEVALKNLQILKKHTWLHNFKTKAQALKDSKIVEPIANTALELNEKITKAFAEVEIALQAKNPNRLKSLFHIKVLETLLFDETNSPFALGRYSVVKLLNSFETADAIINYQKKLSHTSYLADILFAGSRSPNENVFDSWQDFLLSLESKIVEKNSLTEENFLMGKIEKLREMIFALEKTNSLSIFMTLFFKNENDPIKTLDNILSFYSQKNEKIIQDLLVYRDQINNILDKLDNFANLKTFDNAFDELEKLSSNFYNEKVFKGLLTLKSWQKSSSITKTIAIKVMNNFVDLYDKAIKTMKASQNIANSLKVKMFQEMLFPYFQSLKFIAENFIEHETIPWKDIMINDLERLLKSKNVDLVSELYPSNNFDVRCYSLNTKLKLSESISLEDIFTTIHQNHLFVISNLISYLNDDGLLDKSLPKGFTQLIDSFKERRNMDLTEVEISSKQIEMKFNIPLDEHSGSLTFIYDTKTKKTKIALSFFGVNLYDRWYIAKEISEFLDHFNILPLKSPVKFQNDDKITTQWEIDIENQGNQLNTLLDFYDTIIEYSLSPFFEEISDFFDPIISKNAISFNQLINYYSNHEAKFIFLTNIFIKKIQANENIDEIIQMASFGIENDKHFKKKDMILIFRELVKHDKMIKKAIDIAKEEIKNNSLRVRKAALKLFLELVKKGEAFEEAIEAAKEKIRDGFWNVKKATFELFQELVKQGKGFEEAEKAAEENINDRDWHVRKAAFELFQELVIQGKGFEKAEKAAKIKINDKHKYVREEALTLFKELVKQGKGFKEAGVAAKEGIKDIDQFVREEALKLFHELVQRDECLEEAEKAAKEGIKDIDQFVRKAAFELLKEIKRKQEEKASIASGKRKRDQDFEKAIDAATIGIKDNHANVREEALRNFQELVKQGKGFEKAIAAAKEGIKDDNKYVREEALKLFHELVQRDECFEEVFKEAFEAAEKGIKDIDVFVSIVAYEFIQELVRKREEKASIASGKRKRDQS